MTITTQPELPFTGEQLRDRGMAMAEEHANQVHDQWSADCLSFLIIYSAEVETFMCEDFRKWCAGKLPTPPDNRAFGGVMRRAANAGYIHSVGMGNHKDPKCHKGFATIWKRTPII